MVHARREQGRKRKSDRLVYKVRNIGSGQTHKVLYTNPGVP